MATAERQYAVDHADFDTPVRSLKPMQKLAIFDLDNTLIAGDSDHAWGEFLIEQGAVEETFYRSENARFYAEYQRGDLDIFEFLEFALAPLARHQPGDLLRWRDQFIAEKIMPMRLQAAEAEIAARRDRDYRPIIITATNRFVTEPIARMLGIEVLLATDPEQIDGRYTGEVDGTPCYQEGKITRLSAWATEQGIDPWSGCFYSDSLNDIPLLERVAEPIAVDPDPSLKQHAESRGWPVISFREAQ